MKFLKILLLFMITETNLVTIGRRKCSVAQVLLTNGNGLISINGKTLDDYIQNNPKIISIIKSPLVNLGFETNYDILVKVKGGGLTGQSEAIRLGIARALALLTNDEGKNQLRKNGFLTRDARSKERRKYGLKKARKASQFSKR